MRIIDRFPNFDDLLQAKPEDFGAEIILYLQAVQEPRHQAGSLVNAILQKHTSERQFTELNNRDQLYLVVSESLT
jgi:hypothetical protein